MMPPRIPTELYVYREYEDMLVHYDLKSLSIIEVHYDLNEAVDDELEYARKPGIEAIAGPIVRQIVIENGQRKRIARVTISVKKKGS